MTGGAMFAIDGLRKDPFNEIDQAVKQIGCAGIKLFHE